MTQAPNLFFSVIFDRDNSWRGLCHTYALIGHGERISIPKSPKTSCVGRELSKSLSVHSGLSASKILSIVVYGIPLSLIPRCDQEIPISFTKPIIITACPNKSGITHLTILSSKDLISSFRSIISDFVATASRNAPSRASACRRAFSSVTPPALSLSMKLSLSNVIVDIVASISTPSRYTLSPLYFTLSKEFGNKFPELTTAQGYGNFAMHTKKTCVGKTNLSVLEASNSHHCRGFFYGFGRIGPRKRAAPQGSIGFLIRPARQKTNLRAGFTMNLRGLAMSTNLIPHIFEETTIKQRAKDGYIDATAMCKAGGKRWGTYRQNAATEAFLAALESEVGIPTSKLIQSVSGGKPELQGTWVHPDVSIHLAMWISPKFSVWAIRIIKDYITNTRTVPVKAHTRKVPATLDLGGIDSAMQRMSQSELKLFIDALEQPRPEHAGMSKLITYLDIILMDGSMLQGTHAELSRVKRLATKLKEAA